MTLQSSVPTERVGWQVWAGFSAMCVGMFMAILDIQIVATSLPAIRDALNISADQMSWIQTAYLIAEVIAIPLTGLLSRAQEQTAHRERARQYSRWRRLAVPTALTLQH